MPEILIASQIVKAGRRFRCKCGHCCGPGSLIVIVPEHEDRCYACAVRNDVRNLYTALNEMGNDSSSNARGSKNRVVTAAPQPQPPEWLDELGIPWTEKFSWFTKSTVREESEEAA